MKITTLIISFILLSGSALAVFLFYADTYVNYQLSGNYTNESSAYYIRFNQTIYDISGKMVESENITSGTGGVTDITTIQDPTLTFLPFMGRIIWHLPGLLKTGIDNLFWVSSGILPKWILGVIAAILGTVIAMTVAAILFKRDEI